MPWRRGGWPRRRAIGRQGEVDLARAAALSDGIFAVAMTLLIVALPLPKSAAELAGLALSKHLLTLFRCLAQGDAALMCSISCCSSPSR